MLSLRLVTVDNWWHMALNKVKKLNSKARPGVRQGEKSTTYHFPMAYFPLQGAPTWLSLNLMSSSSEVLPVARKQGLGRSTYVELAWTDANAACPKGMAGCWAWLGQAG